MLLVNSLGTAINITYICFYYMYTNEAKEKTLVWAQLGYAGAFVMAVIAYTHIEDPKVLLFRYGILLTLVLFYFIGSPLLGLVCICHLRIRKSVLVAFLIVLAEELLSAG